MIHPKKRISLTLSFVPTKPGTNTTKQKKIDPTMSEKNKNLIRERLFELEAFRRDQLELMKRKKQSISNLKTPVEEHLKSSKDSSEADFVFVLKQSGTKKGTSRNLIQNENSKNKLKTPHISFKKMDFDPEIEVTSALINKRIDHLVEISKLMASKVQKLATPSVVAKEYKKVTLEPSEISNESSYNNQFDNTVDSEYSYVTIRNIDYTDKNINSVAQVKQSKRKLPKNVIHSATELPHSTSISDIGSVISDGLDIINLPPLPKQAPISNAKSYSAAYQKGESDIKQSVSMASAESKSLTNIYNELLESHPHAFPAYPEAHDISTHEIEYNFNSSDPKSMIINGLERLLKYELRATKDSSEILYLLKTILETKKLVNEFTSPDISEFTQTFSTLESQNVNTAESPSPNRSSGSRLTKSPKSDYQPKIAVVEYFDDFETDYTNTAKNDASQVDSESIIEVINEDVNESYKSSDFIRTNSIKELIKASEDLTNHTSPDSEVEQNDSIKELIRASEALSNELTDFTLSNFSVGIAKMYESPQSFSNEGLNQVTTESFAEQIDSLISAAMDISKMTTNSSDPGNNEAISEIYKSDFESISIAKDSQIADTLDTTDTTELKGRVSKLRTDIESKLKEHQEMKEEKEREKKERKRKMKEQESQLKDRLAQIEDTIADMLKGNFPTDAENNLDEKLELLDMPKKHKPLDVFEVERSIENIVEKVFLSASREMSQHSSLGSSKSSTPQKISDSSLNAEELLKDPATTEEVCAGIFDSLMEEAFTDMLYINYQVKELFPTFDIPSINNIIDTLFIDLPTNLSRDVVPKISDGIKISGPEVHIIMDLLNEAYAFIWTNFKSETVSKERMVREMKRKLESWVTYKCDDFFDEILMDEVKIEEKTWEQFTTEKDEIITEFANVIFQTAYDDSLKQMTKLMK